MSSGGAVGARRAWVAVGVLAAALYSNFLLDWVLRGFRGMGDIVSLLESPGQQNSTLLRVTDVVCAVLVVALLPRARRVLPAGPWRGIFVGATAAFASGAVVAAVVASPCGPDVACTAAADQPAVHVHDAASLVSDTALYVGVAAVWIACRTSGPRPLRRFAWWCFWVGGVLGTLTLSVVTSGSTSPLAGYAQRVHILCMSVWLVGVGLMAAQGARPGARPPGGR